MEEIITEVVLDNVSLWDSFLMLLWSLSVFLRKVSDWLSYWVDATIMLPTETNESFGPTVENKHEQDQVQEVSEGVIVRAESVVDEQLFPRLLDTVSSARIWLRMVHPPNPADLFQFKRINMRWHRFVTALLEWSPLMFVRMDTLGYLRILQQEE